MLRWIVLCAMVLCVLAADYCNGASSCKCHLHEQDIVEIKRMAFYGLNSVKELHLTNNSLTRLEKGTFDGLTKLEYLYLSDNNIEFVEKGTFDRRYLPNLKEISIGGNPIELWHANVTL